MTDVSEARTALDAAFARGDYAELRRLAQGLGEDADEADKAHAAELVARTGVDPATVLVLGASTLFLLWVVFTWVI